MDTLKKFACIHLDSHNHVMNEIDQTPQPYSVRIPPAMRKQLEEFAKQGGRSLHAEILQRLGASLGASSGNLKSEFSENISGLGEKTEYVTREEVRELMREVLIENGVIPK
jgi:hypothetical protein